MKTRSQLRDNGPVVFIGVLNYIGQVDDAPLLCWKDVITRRRTNCRQPRDKAIGITSIPPLGHHNQQCSQPQVPLGGDSCNCVSLESAQLVCYWGPSPLQLSQHTQSSMHDSIILIMQRSPIVETIKPFYVPKVQLLAVKPP